MQQNYYCCFVLFWCVFVCLKKYQSKQDNFFGSHFGYINEDGLITEFYAIFRPTNVALLQQIQELLECGANTNNDDDSSDDSDGDWFECMYF